MINEDAAKIRIERFDKNCRADFFELHSEKNGGGWCYCVAWWVDTWENWGQRTASENRRYREGLLDEGNYDGYLAYILDKPVGWCQVGPRDRLKKLVRQFDLKPDPDAWAITCFHIAPAYRRQRLASYMLKAVLDDLSNRGIKKVEAFPRHDNSAADDDLWTGPKKMYLKAGFKQLAINDKVTILILEL